MAFLLEKMCPIRKRRRVECEGAPEVLAERLIRLAAVVLRRGNLSRIVVRSEGAVVLDTSVTAGVLAAIASPRLILFGIVAVLLSPWAVEIDKPEDQGQDAQ